MVKLFSVYSGAEYGGITSPLSGGLTFLQGEPDPIHQGKAAFKAMGRFACVVPTIVFHGTEDPVSWPLMENRSCNNGWKQILTIPAVP